MKHLLRLPITVLAVAALAGCTSIPKTGPVVTGQSINSDPRDGVLQAILEEPVAGQSPDQVVLGFINASVGFGDDHRVARSFLAPSRRLVWSPDASVSVYPAQRTLSVVSAKTTSKTGKVTPSATAPAAPEHATVTVKTEVNGLIDASGRYSVAKPGQTVTKRFGLIRSEGDWRIDSLDDGILVNSSDFAVTFRPFPVYFADPAGRYLVPDVHWLPANRDATGVREVPTALVRALLEGPSPYLRGAVISGAPAGTKMAVAAVVVSDQVATVDLTEPVRRASARQKQLLLSQLRATLGIGTISGVQITVRRAPLDIPADAENRSGPGDPAAADANSPVQGQPQVDPQVDDEPVVLNGKGVVSRLAGRTLTPVNGVGGLAVPGANRPAVSADRSAYAVLNADRSRLLLQLPSAKVSTLVRGKTLTGPSFDPWGWVWTSGRDNPGWVSAARPDPGRVKVASPWLAGKSVIALRISREGARALVAVDVAGTAHVFVAGVVRDENGQPVRLTQPLGILPDLRTVIDASWVDEDQVVVLGHRLGTDGVEPWVAQIGGVIKPTLPIKGAQSVSAANGELGLMVGTAEGTLTQVARSWSRISDARWASFAG